MKYTDQQIRDNIKEFIMLTNQDALCHVISFCIGYYGYITKQIWLQIHKLRGEGYIVF